MGKNHPVIRQLQVSSFPRPIVIDRAGGIFSNNARDLRGNPVALADVLNRALGVNKKSESSKKK